MVMHAKKAWSAGWWGVARVAGRLGLALVIFLAGYLLVYRPQQLRWGATDEEVARAMPVSIGLVQRDIVTRYRLSGHQTYRWQSSL